MIRQIKFKERWYVARSLAERDGPENPTPVVALTAYGALLNATGTDYGDWKPVTPVPGDRECWSVWPQKGGKTFFFIRRHGDGSKKET